MTIFMLAGSYEDDNRYSVVNIDEDYGYFDTREDAEAYIERVFGALRREYNTLVEQHRDDIEEWRKKNAEARALGFEYPFWKAPSYPQSPDIPVVVEITKNTD